MAITGHTLDVTNFGTAEGNKLVVAIDHDTHRVHLGIVPGDLLLDGADRQGLMEEVMIHGLPAERELTRAVLLVLDGAG